VGTMIHSIPPQTCDSLMPEWPPLRMVIRPPSSSSKHDFLSSMEDRLTSVPGGSFRNGQTSSSYKRRVIKVRNPTKKPITVSDKLHFSDINENLEFDRGFAWGFQLKEMMLFPPRAEISVVLVPLSNNQKEALGVSAEREAARRRKEGLVSKPEPLRIDISEEPLSQAIADPSRSLEKLSKHNVQRGLAEDRYLSQKANRIERTPQWRDDPEVFPSSKNQGHQQHQKYQGLWGIQARPAQDYVPSFEPRDSQRNQRLPVVEVKTQGEHCTQPLFHQRRAVYKPSQINITGGQRAQSAGPLAMSQSSTLLQSLPSPILTSSNSNNNILRKDKRSPENGVIGFGWQQGQRSANAISKSQPDLMEVPGRFRPKSSSGRVQQRADNRAYSSGVTHRTTRPEWSNDFKNYHKTHQQKPRKRQSHEVRLKKLAKAEKYYQNLLDSTNWEVDEDHEPPAEAFAVEAIDHRKDEMRLTADRFSGPPTPGNIASYYKNALATSEHKHKKRNNTQPKVSPSRRIRNSSGHLLVTRNTSSTNQRLLTMLEINTKAERKKPLMTKTMPRRRPHTSQDKNMYTL